jgi:hypothetical protein
VLERQQTGFTMTTVRRGKIILISVQGKKVQAQTKLFLSRIFKQASESQIEAKINNAPSILTTNISETLGRKLAAGLNQIGATAEFVLQSKMWKSDQPYRLAVPMSSYYQRSQGHGGSRRVGPQSISQWQKLRNMVVLCCLAMLTVVTVYGLAELMIPQDRIYEVSEIMVPRFNQKADRNRQRPIDPPIEQLPSDEAPSLPVDEQNPDVTFPSQKN